MSTYMAKEIREIPDVIAKQGESNAPMLIKLAEFIKKETIHGITLLGRGSSKNACYYAKYIFETALNIPVSMASPSVASIYDRTLNFNNHLLFVCSQSGSSPDLIKYAENAKAGGATLIGLVNDENSPLAKMSDFLFGLKAGKEHSVAATKSYIATIYAFASIYAMFCGKNDLADELYHLPEVMDQVVHTRWDQFSDAMVTEDQLFCLGRSFNFSTAKEVALKFNETCQVFAKDYSSSEFFHGPLALIERGIPILHFLMNDESHRVSVETTEKLLNLGANVYTVDSKAFDEKTLVIPASSPLIQPMIQTTALYSIIEEIAMKKGMNPDEPPFLNKVTKTV
ncbi:Hypothetical protein F387_01025 [Wohlfahrtiimonas chitiniclastica SH04]|uniref:SIS domain-containing protein n=1 Tax=Wohlfahrtiimonas chitiniclastica SH04 TaxID=1261130 RepID=L8XYM2_9GAMM|nr:SIS domain-containing protein [Wohlfahrtiimonas chitiniclastica]ELV09133.1 Hypothetical protein F387_01025 [Wohlfahrtiimonas chitiniclastica SH04]KZX37781.1 SIS domain-containing protein [Wohlfahrtiimonas chitiniclastica]MBS7814720.1 SIS domain-containing protein [Wohlfahrtiimonas chitiniclastica]